MEEPKFIGKVKLTKQGQITLPQEARNDLNIEQEADLYWYELGDSLILVRELVNQKELLDSILKHKKKRK
ncbi:MAG: AbrB/MazE/SpoVT family DNA-binding domain-containing protein [Nanoarchaeota archaeon]|nr:AbrB/MazE/SpoVT family DNA-binding domain-containing protein [Nanoarchaeota archaeon]